MDLHVSTMLWVCFGACLAIGPALGLVSRRTDTDGSHLWALALCAQAAAFLLPALYGTPPGILIISVSLISIAYALYLLAVSRFLGRQETPLHLVLPPVAMVGTLLIGRFPVSAIIGNLILIGQTLLICHPLLIHKFDFPSRGRALLLFALALTIVATALRGLAALAPMSAPATDLTDYLAFFALILTANGFILMAKEHTENVLRRSGTRDHLTGCWNRIHIEEVVEQELDRLKRYGYPVSLIMIDIDRIGRINDRFGHAVGDEILQEFGAMVRSTIRTTDIVGRWGGEEFVIVMPSSGFQEVLPLANRLRMLLERHAFPGGVQATASFGIAVARSTDAQATDWVGRAEKALRTAKEEGRNQTRVEDLELNQSELTNDCVRITQLRWRESYATGNAVVDAQHRNLFAKANALLMMGTDPREKSDVLSVAQPLLKAIKDHFAYEDRMLAQAVGLDEFLARAHIGMHAYLAKRVDSILERFQHGDAGIAALFHFVVYEYVTQHVLIEDHKIRTLLATAKPE